MKCKKCKKCKKAIKEKKMGLRDFCSEECKKEYRETYKRLNAQKGQKAKKTGCSIKTPKSEKIDKSTPTVSTVWEDPIDEIAQPVTLHESYGGIKWYYMAKKYCCNFHTRDLEGYCVTLAEPYVTFECECKNCILGIAMMKKYTKGDENAYADVG